MRASLLSSISLRAVHMKYPADTIESSGGEGSRGCRQANPGDSRSFPKSPWLLDADKMRGTAQGWGKQPSISMGCFSQHHSPRSCPHRQMRERKRRLCTLQPVWVLLCGSCEVWEGFKRCILLSWLSHPASQIGFALFVSSSCCCSVTGDLSAGECGAG